jgi:hypothetical protein
MSFLRAAVKEVVGLFVSDWVQSAVVVAIIALGWLAVARLGAPAVVVLVLLLAAQLVWFARADARRRSRA